MRAILCKEYGPPSSLTMAEVPDPVPGPDDLLIEVRAAGVNFPDALLIQGKYQVKPPLPFSPGVECAGVVAAAGADVTAFRAGDRVGVNAMGSFAERVVAPAALAIPLPDDVDDVTAAGMIMTYGTAYHGLVDRARLRAGERVVVTGAAGGVGIATVDIAAALGARVVAIASTEAKRALCRERGAEAALDPADPELHEAIRRATEGGFDVALDNVGGDGFAALLRAARWQARLLIVGFAGGTIPQIPANRLLLKELDALGVYWGDWKRANPAADRANFAAMFGLIREGRLHPRVDATYAFADAPKAIADMGERRLVGKAVVRVA